MMPLPDSNGRPEWVPVKNASGEEIPAFALMKPTGIDANTAFQIVGKPDSTDPSGLLVNGPAAIPIGQSGHGTFHPRVIAAYDAVPGAPVAGDEHGPVSGSWLLAKGGRGFRCLGGAGFGVANWVRWQLSPAQAAGEQENASISYTVTTSSVWEDTGFGTLAIPAAGTYLLYAVYHGVGLATAVSGSTGGSYVAARLYDVTIGAAVSSTVAYVCTVPVANQLCAQTASVLGAYTVDGPRTIRVEGYRSAATTWSNATISPGVLAGQRNAYGYLPLNVFIGGSSGAAVLSGEFTNINGLLLGNGSTLSGITTIGAGLALDGGTF